MTHLAWPDLSYDAWKDTYATLHMWAQIVGKIRLARMPWLNHTWQVTLYPNATGLTTGRMPYGDEAFEIDFDFIAHELNIRTSRGDQGVIQLVPMSVADFYGSVMEALKAFHMPVSIYRKPAEVAAAVLYPANPGANQVCSCSRLHEAVAGAIDLPDHRQVAQSWSRAGKSGHRHPGRRRGDQRPEARASRAAQMPKRNLHCSRASLTKRDSSGRAATTRSSAVRS